MRELKFRFYDKLEEEMVYSNKSCLSEFFDDYDNSMPNAEIMQFAGLLDKNGVEIYESDVVSNKIIKGRVAFNHFCFGVYDKNDDFMMLNRCYVDLEVIGNIYEDSHLMDNSVE